MSFKSNRTRKVSLRKQSRIPSINKIAIRSPSCPTTFPLLIRRRFPRPPSSAILASHSLTVFHHHHQIHPLVVSPQYNPDKTTNKGLLTPNRTLFLHTFPYEPFRAAAPRPTHHPPKLSLQTNNPFNQRRNILRPRSLMRFCSPTRHLRPPHSISNPLAAPTTTTTTTTTTTR